MAKKIAKPAPAPLPEPLERVDRPLTADEKLKAFRTATGSFARWYADAIAVGMTDPDLEAALERGLGIGGSFGPNELDVSFNGSGLRIWASTTLKNHSKEKPIFAGSATLAMAREVYGIINPQDRQMRLF